VTDRTGIAEFVRDRGALVVSPEREAIREAIARVLWEPELAERLRAGGLEVAAELSPPVIVARQEELYRRAIAGT
jgi:glycosyltransferase involved in cell wall biosynthesis